MTQLVLLMMALGLGNPGVHKDDTNLYFGVYAHDSEIAHVVISDLKKDFPNDANDTLEIVLDTFRDQRNGYIFATNAAGAKGDAQMSNEGRETNWIWDGVWYVKTGVADEAGSRKLPFHSRLLSSVKAIRRPGASIFTETCAVVSATKIVSGRPYPASTTSIAFRWPGLLKVWKVSNRDPMSALNHI